mmetsp:Transcript_60511/g.148460  ORF Transcript_60511/g.148460 Transcript_60511/m.148460 type:complete len:211 (+) Transcript_60511:629-1261(+)
MTTVTSIVPVVPASAPSNVKNPLADVLSTLLLCVIPTMLAVAVEAQTAAGWAFTSVNSMTQSLMPSSGTSARIRNPLKFPGGGLSAPTAATLPSPPKIVNLDDVPSVIVIVPPSAMTTPSTSSDNPPSDNDPETTVAWVKCGPPTAAMPPIHCPAPLGAAPTSTKDAAPSNIDKTAVRIIIIFFLLIFLLLLYAFLCVINKYLTVVVPGC